MARAQDHYRQSLALAKPSGNRSIEALTVAWIAARTPADQREHAYQTAIERLVELRDWMGMWICLESLAAHWARTDPLMAGRILGFLELVNQVRARLSPSVSAPAPHP